MLWVCDNARLMSDLRMLLAEMDRLAIADLAVTLARSCSTAVQRFALRNHSRALWRVRTAHLVLLRHLVEGERTVS